MHAKICLMLKTFASFSFGCRVNEAEKITNDRKLLSYGFTYNAKNPEFFIIYSCAVTNKAEHEVRQFINKIKRTLPNTKIVLTGCAATQWINNNKTSLENIMMVNNMEKMNIPNKLQNMNFESKPKSGKYQDKFMNSGRIIIKIQDGCSRFCSYCIVPFLRGKPESKTISEIIKEILSFTEPIYEIILSGINTEYFGYKNGENLTDLIDTILSKTEIPRISLGSLHPWSLNSSFLKWYEKNCNNNRFVKFLHIPLQSGSKKILNLMNRGYKPADMQKILQKIVNIYPNTYIGTDIIVGYPGENNIDFIDTLNYLEDSPISKIHVFRFSNKIGTKNFKTNITINNKILSERSKKLRLLSEQKMKKFITKLIGYRFNALVLKQKTTEGQMAVLDNGIPAIIINKSSKITPYITGNAQIVDYKNGKVNINII